MKLPFDAENLILWDNFEFGFIYMSCKEDITCTVLPSMAVEIVDFCEQFLQGNHTRKQQYRAFSLANWSPAILLKRNIPCFSQQIFKRPLWLIACEKAGGA